VLSQFEFAAHQGGSKKRNNMNPITIIHNGSETCLDIKLAPGVTAAYIEMNGRTYYIDDSTDEAIMNNWITPKELEVAK